jgi:hypothetical protein
LQTQRNTLATESWKARRVLRRFHIGLTALINSSVIFLALLLAVFVGVRIGTAPLNYQDIITYLALIAIVIIVFQKHGLEIGFFTWIAMFALGFRTIKANTPLIVARIANDGRPDTTFLTTGLTPILRIHPLFVIIFLLIGILLLQRAVHRRTQVVWLLPKILLFFSLFWIWGWARGVETGTNWVDRFYEISTFLMIAPIFVVTATLLQNKALWKPAVAAFFVTGAFIAFMGLLEIVFPAIRQVIPAFISSEQSYYLTQEGFVRGIFSFWGQSGAAFVVAITMPLIICLWSWHRLPSQRIFYLVCLALDVIGVYVAGWRSLWLLMILVTLGLLLLRGRWLGAVGFILLLVVTYSFLPLQTQQRVDSLLIDIQGNYQDNSAAVRAGRIQAAIQTIENNPLGVGWNGAGWVHNDFLQITADLGVIPGLLFAIWYLRTLFGIGRAFYESPDPLKLALVGAFAICGGLMLLQPMIVLAQYIAPIWFVWALVETKLRQTADEKVSHGADEAVGIGSNLQLPSPSA